MTASNVHPFNTPHRVFQDALNLIRAGAHETMRRERPGMSDQDRDAEFEAQNIFFSSLSHFRADCERAIAMSPLRGAQIKEQIGRAHV